MRDKDTRRAVGRHVARFILVGLYTGTRSSAICRAALGPTIGRGHVDLEQGVFYRRAIGRLQTKKRQPPVRLPLRLLAHLRRWSRRGLAKGSVVEWNGKAVESVRKGFEAAVRTAGLGADVTPHVLRHTCATWLILSPLPRCFDLFLEIEEIPLQALLKLLNTGRHTADCPPCSEPRGLH